jgi:tetratricopeptide (TPR) repeat protein
MGTTGRSGLSRVLMGSVTEKVVRQVPCSFITIKMQDIIRLRFDREVSDIKNHFMEANDLVEKGKYEEAISQYLICLQINNMHIPSIYKLAVVYSLTGNNEKADYYDNMARKLLGSLWDRKINDEIRTHFDFEC